MKKVIEGVLYNTETAKWLAVWRNAGSWRDFSHCEETLYRTKSGKYFIHGEGGAMTKYAQSSGQNSWSGGEKIEPVSRKTAQEWAEEKLSGDEYQEIFGPVAEGPEQEALNVLIPASLKALLKAEAETRSIAISALVEDVLSILHDKKELSELLASSCVDKASGLMDGVAVRLGKALGWKISSAIGGGEE